MPASSGAPSLGPTATGFGAQSMSASPAPSWLPANRFGPPSMSALSSPFGPPANPFSEQRVNPPSSPFVLAPWVPTVHSPPSHLTTESQALWLMGQDIGIEAWNSSEAYRAGRGLPSSPPILSTSPPGWIRNPAGKFEIIPAVDASKAVPPVLPQHVARVSPVSTEFRIGAAPPSPRESFGFVDVPRSISRGPGRLEAFEQPRGGLMSVGPPAEPAEPSADAAPGYPQAGETVEPPPAASPDAADEPSTAVDSFHEAKDEEETSGDEPKKEKLATELAVEKETAEVEPAVEDDFADIWQTHEVVHRVIVEPVEHRVRFIPGNGESGELGRKPDEGVGSSDRDPKAEVKAARKMRRAQDRADQKFINEPTEGRSSSRSLERDSARGERDRAGRA